MLYKQPSSDYPYIWNKGIWRVVLTTTNRIWVFNFAINRAGHPFQLKDNEDDADISHLPKYVQEMIRKAIKIRRQILDSQNNS